ncbi:hypothetical protein A3Q56_01616 [Intoshia linei]|uniref:Uncharacterized protein n=1 Tax=Intoshia linei TaxID=1819745 RepID=A0A177B8Z5_9BILA|nr:hypothetical protein A3Q56_01616 [Intoshia linei]
MNYSYDRVSKYYKLSLHIEVISRSTNCLIFSWYLKLHPQIFINEVVFKNYTVMSISRESNMKTEQIPLYEYVKAYKVIIRKEGNITAYTSELSSATTLYKASQLESNTKYELCVHASMIKHDIKISFIDSDIYINKIQHVQSCLRYISTIPIICTSTFITLTIVVSVILLHFLLAYILYRIKLYKHNAKTRKHVKSEEIEIEPITDFVTNV